MLLQAVATPLFAVVIALWSTGFGETWKRKQAELAHFWNMEEFEVRCTIRVLVCFTTEGVRRPLFRLSARMAIVAVCPDGSRRTKSGLAPSSSLPSRMESGARDLTSHRRQPANFVAPCTASAASMKIKSLSSIRSVS